MAIQIQSGASSDLMTVDATSKAGRVSPYDVRGNFTGQKATYSASTTAKTATVAGTTPFFYFCGSATKTIRIQKIVVCGTVATAAVYGDVVLYKRTANGTFGTSTTLTLVPADSTSSAATATNVRIVTAGSPTAGTGGGAINTAMVFMPVTGTPANGITPIIFDYQNRTEAEALVLRGTAEGIELAFGTTTTNAPTVTVSIIWTEE